MVLISIILSGLNYTFFVKGTQYWKFDNWKVEVVGEPRSFQEDWLGCPPAKTSNKVLEEETEVAQKQHEAAPSLGLIIGMSVGGAILVLVVILLIVLKQRRTSKEETVIDTVTSSENQLYSPGFNKSTNTENSSTATAKTSRVNSAHQKLRMLRFSLQSKV